MLQKLYLPSKSLKHVEIADFCGLRQLLSLNLEENEFTSAPHMCSVKCSLEYLHLEGNKISRISKKYFKDFKKIRITDLNMNNIILLPDLHWVQHSLASVLVADNHVTSLEAFQTFNISQKLYYIDMGCNNIKSINATLLRHMPKLSRLLLYTNEIAHVDDLWSFNDIEVNLIDNPLHCGAALSWMGEKDLMLEHGFTCATPVCLQDMVIADMSKLLKQIPRPEHIEVETKLPTFCEESFKLICFCINCCYLSRIQLKYVHNGKITISRCWLW